MNNNSSASGSDLIMALFKSLDGGTTWNTHRITTTAGAGLAVAVDTANDQVIYVGGGLGTTETTGALYKTSDGGQSWTRVGTGVFAQAVKDLAVDPETPAILYAGTADGLFKSEDGGATWTRKAAYPVTCIKVNPAATSQVYITGLDGVYFSADRGQSWTDMSNALAVRDVIALDFNPANRTLLAGSNGGGVYRNRQSSQFVLSLSAATGGTTNPAPGNHAYPQGSSVTVTALPDAHYAFAGWTGSVASAANPITITMDSDKSLTAGFNRTIYPPRNAAGVKKANSGLLAAEYINILTWRSHPDNVNITGYRVYLVSGGAPRLLESMNGSTFEYRHRKVEKDTAYTYSLRAVDGAGREGLEALVTVR